MYEIAGTERNNEKAAVFETKSMLYLMNYYEQSNRIKYFVIDFFNDVTGVDESTETCFDVQSKGRQDTNAKSIGKYLVSLFKNYLSEFNFEEFILFIEGVNKKIRKNIGDKNIFRINDLTDELKDDVISGLKQEAENINYIKDKSKITDENIGKFLDRVIFVIDEHSNIEYIKDAVQFRPQLIEINDDYLISIFNEIRDLQSIKKNIKVEKEKIKSIGCFLQYGKYLSKSEIENLIICRICFKTGIQEIGRRKSIPKPFSLCLNSIDSSQHEELLTKCEDDIFRLLNNIINKEHFWNLFEEVYRIIMKYPEKNVTDIYDLVDQTKFDSVCFLNTEESCKYYIALIKGGIEWSQ